MADIKITGPDGSTFAFPVGTSAETIEGAMRSHYATYNVPAQETAAAPLKAEAAPDKRDSFLGKVDAAVRGAADTMTFGLADEMSAAANATLQPLFGLGKSGASWSERYKANKADENAIDQSDAENRFGYRLGGQLAGGVTQAAGLAKSGLSATANAIEAGKSLPRVALAGGKEGAIVGGLYGAGSGEGIEERGQGAITSGIAGMAVGGAIPPLTAGISAVGKPLVAPLLARLRPDQYAAAAVGEGVKRSGREIDDIARIMQGARMDGQDGFMVADAMGNAGQRMLSTVTRTPNDARQGVAEALMSRQMDQGRRVAGALHDASGSPMTASQYEQALTQQRSANAGRNYAPVEQDVNPINVSRPVSIANRTISPAADNVATSTGAVPTDLAARAGIEAGEAAIRDPIREAVKTARSYLASDTLTVTNVEKAFRAKTNIDQMIAKATEEGRGCLLYTSPSPRD